jgi:hypothetical protein
LEIQDRTLLDAKDYTEKFLKENGKQQDAKAGNESNRARIQSMSDGNDSKRVDLK